MAKLDEMLSQFMDLDLTAGDEIIFTEQAKNLIHEIADECSNTPQYRLDSLQNVNKFESPEDVYRTLTKYEEQNLPVAIYLFPIMDDMLKRMETYENFISGQEIRY